MAIEPVGSASRGVPGESSRRSAAAVEPEAAPAAAPAASASSSQSNTAKATPVAAKPANGFGWQTNVDEACRLARQHNLPVMVFVTSAHCPYCTKMKDQTFRTTAVAQELGTKFVPLRVERGSNPGLERQLAIKSYPTMVVLRSDKVEVTRMTGFIQPPQFLGNLKRIEAQWTVANAQRQTKVR
jgi:protein disulfide-isomerase